MMSDLRGAIAEGRAKAFADGFLARYRAADAG
jgi:hypothetical protein